MPLGSFPYIKMRAEIYMGLFLGQPVNSIALYTLGANRLCVATFPNAIFGTNIIRGVFMTDKKQDTAEPFSGPGHLFSVSSTEHLHFTLHHYNPSTSSPLSG